MSSLKWNPWGPQGIISKILTHEGQISMHWDKNGKEYVIYKYVSLTTHLPNPFILIIPKACRSKMRSWNRLKQNKVACQHVLHKTRQIKWVSFLSFIHLVTLHIMHAYHIWVFEYTFSFIHDSRPKLSWTRNSPTSSLNDKSFAVNVILFTFCFVFPSKIMLISASLDSFPKFPEIFKFYWTYYTTKNI